MGPNRLEALCLATLVVSGAGCVRGVVPGGPSYGSVMADVARRFELVGKAVVAGRFELAAYELGEIDETFVEALPHATLPKEGHPEVLPALVAEFREKHLPGLRRALDARDAASSTAEFAQLAGACNGCHRASGHGFIEVPLAAGREVPSLGP